MLQLIWVCKKTKSLPCSVLDSLIPFNRIYLLVGSALIWDLLLKAWRCEFGSDLLAGISILTSFFLGEYLKGGEYLTGAIVIFMPRVCPVDGVVIEGSGKMDDAYHARGLGVCCCGL